MTRTDDPRAQYRSSEYRRSQTPRNLVGAVVICLGIALVLAFFLPRDDSPTTPATVDFASIGAAAQEAENGTLAIPTLPAGWSANTATWQAAGSDAPAQWYVSYLTPSGTQISVKQAFDVSETWIYAAMGNRNASGTATIAALEWQVYDQSPTETGIRYGLTTTLPAGENTPRSTLLLYGSADDTDFAALASALIDSVSTITLDTDAVPS